MKNKAPRRFRLTSFILPGFHHLTSGYTLKGLVFITLSITIGTLAVSLNQYFFLPYLWKLKGLLLPHVLVQEFYATKQVTAYNFVYIYLIVGTGAFLDLAFSLASPTETLQRISTKSNTEN
jgi:hypothetical protein